MSTSIQFEQQTCCPLCGGIGIYRHKGLRDRIFGVPGDFSLRACSNAACGAMWLDPRPSKSTLSFAYQNYYTHTSSDASEFTSLSLRKKLSRLWDDISSRAHIEEVYGYTVLGPRTKPFKRILAVLAHTRPAFCSDWDLIVRWQPASARGRLLDVGCGNGDSLAFLAKLGWQVEGTEVDPSSVAFARSRGLSIHQGDLETLNLPRASYDVVTMSHVIEHVHQPGQLVARCKALLKPGGSLVVVTPNIDGTLYKRYRSDWLHLDPPRHLVLFTARALRRLAVNEGFREVSVSSSLRAFSVLDHASRSIRISGRYSWSQNSQGFLSTGTLALRERVAALKLASGQIEGDELVLEAKA